MISETNGATGEIIREYIWFGLSPVAVTGVDGSHFIHTDHLGRPTFVTDPSGDLIWDGGITTPFGVSLNTVGAFTQSPQHLLKSIHWIDLPKLRVSPIQAYGKIISDTGEGVENTIYMNNGSENLLNSYKKFEEFKNII